MWSFAGFAGSHELVPAGAQWQYQDSGIDLGSAWRQPGYDDASWPSGTAQLGYGDGDEVTALRSSPVSPCYYFRHTFSVTDPARFSSLNLELLRDDGAVVYLNGTEVARYNLPAGAITFNTWASSATEYSWDAPQSIPNLLAAGMNVIAVEVHQGNATSTDVSFDLKLTATSEIQLALNSPAQDALGVPTAPELSATASHPDGNSLTVNFYGRPAPPAEPDFTVVVLPDTQNYTAQINGGSKAMLQSQTDWIRANRDALNIVYVAQVGDISQNGDNDTDQSEWLNASAALYSLENPLPGFPEGIPYGAAVGNHDQLVPAGDTAPTTFFNQYFGVAHFSGKSYYGGHYGTANNNHYQFFSAGGVDFLVVYLEFDSTPEQAVLNWANALLQAYPNRRAMVVTHGLLELTGAWIPQGQAIYNALKANPNLFLMLCGHNHGEAQRTDLYAGNTVYTLMADYQTYPNGGSGFLRLMEFSPANNQIRVKTYSPWLNQLETDASSQFTLNCALSSGPAFTLVQQNPGVPSGATTPATWTGLQPDTQYEWFVSATDGLDTKTSELRRFTTAATESGIPPNAPSGLVAIAESDTKILLTWTDNSADETGFQLERSLDGVTWTPLPMLAANTTRLIDGGLTSGTVYFYRVRAWRSSSASETSAAAAAPFIDACASGEIPVVATLSGSSADTRVNDSAYEQITEKFSGGKPGTRSSALEHIWTFNVTPGSSILFLLQAHQTLSPDSDCFVFAYSTDNVTFKSMVAVENTADNNLYQTFALPNTLQGTVYVRVQDTDRTVGNLALDSLFIDQMLIRTDVSPVLAPPAAPLLREAVAGNASVTLVWNPSYGATSYNLWRRTGAETDFYRIASGLTATTYTDSGLVNGTTYEYLVTAVNSYGQSEPSNALSATPQAPLFIAAPASLTAVAGKRKISLTWTQSLTPGVTQNRIYRSTAPGGVYTPLAIIPAATAYSDSVPAGATYYYVVTAIANNQESPYSNSASATAK